MKRTVLAVVCLIASGCVPLEFPAVGRTSTGEAMQGTIKVPLDGSDASFRVFTAAGLDCIGSYDAFDESITLLIPINCNDGREGKVVATRDPTKVKGTAIATLSDGTTAEFIWGQISAKDQAEFLGQNAPSAAPVN